MSVDYIARAFERYTATEPAIQAWVQVNPQQPLGDGPLNGIPFGVKDIIETPGLATEYGSPLYTGRTGAGEAPVVTSLRKAGGVLFGKTTTTAFAYFDPPATRNPRNPEHTPGGSSSGSAAAVAAGVVPFAIGTQTMGSVIRPASFCGITGFKPTFGALPREGVLAFAPSLDTVGFLAETVGVCLRIWTALGFPAAEAPLRFGVPQDLPPVSDEMQGAFGAAVDLVRGAHRVEPVRLPQSYGSLLAAARIVNDYEGARSHEARWREFGQRIGARLAELVSRGLAIPDADYCEARRRLQDAAHQFDGFLTSVPFLLTPAAPGIAPAGLSSTGDPVMNAVWTALGTPVVTIPIPRPSGMPLGLQIIARRNADAALLAAALELETLFCGI